jgi:tRNA(Ile)-lysidine synthetase-like protein
VRTAIPQSTGGTLIRRWIRFLDQAEFKRTEGSQILCAVSGGADSTALAVLVGKYGKRLGQLVGLVHFNHHWRGEESDRDEDCVRGLAQSLRVPVFVGQGKKAARSGKDSPEAAARAERRQFFRSIANQWGPGTRIWTAHHQDDLAETMLWRVLTGAGESHGEGIRAVSELEVRPCLTTTKSELVSFLHEEGLSWQEDRTNREGDLLRTRIRRELAPSLDALFPKWRSHLAKQALGLQRARAIDPSTAPLLTLLTLQGVRIRRAHLEAIEKAVQASGAHTIALAGGRKLTHEPPKRGEKSRWILE